jgi:hypothetical protein
MFKGSFHFDFSNSNIIKLYLNSKFNNSMYQRDYFLKLTQLFTKLLARLMGLKEKGEFSKAVEEIKDHYKSLFELEASDIRNIENEVGWIEYIKSQKHLKPEQLDVLAQLIKVDGDFQEGVHSKSLYRKALELLLYLNDKQKLYSLEREELIKELREKIKT